jgi:hypothetical protein
VGIDAEQRKLVAACVVAHGRAVMRNPFDAGAIVRASQRDPG